MPEPTETSLEMGEIDRILGLGAPPAAPAHPTYDTALTPDEEPAFTAWKQQYAPDDTGEDYDFRGAFKAGLAPGADGHWPDTYKKPNHPTFSNESIYAKVQPQLAGSWRGEQYQPPAPEMDFAKLNQATGGQAMQSILARRKGELEANPDVTDADAERILGQFSQPTVEDPAIINQSIQDAVNDHDFDPVSYAAQHRDNPELFEMARAVYEARKAQGWKDQAGRAFKNTPAILQGAAKGLWQFGKGLIYAPIHAGRQAYSAATDDPNAATRTAETVIAAQKGGVNFDDLKAAIYGAAPGDQAMQGLASAFMAGPDGEIDEEAVERYEAHIPEYLANAVLSAKERPSLHRTFNKDESLNRFVSAFTKLRKGEALTPDERDEVDQLVYSANQQNGEEWMKDWRGRKEFDFDVTQLEKRAQLDHGVPLDEGLVAKSIEARGGDKTSELFGPSSLASIGAEPVNKDTTDELSGVIDPVNVATLRMPFLVPGAKRLGGAAVEAVGRLGQIAEKIPGGKLAIGGAAGGAIATLANGNPDIAAAIALGSAGAYGLKKIGQMSRVMAEAGRAARTGGKQASKAATELAAARLTGQSAKKAWVQNLIGNTAVDMATMVPGMAPINAITSGALPGGREFNAEQFTAAELGSPVFGLLSVGNGIKPQLVEAIRPQLRTQGQEALNRNKSDLGKRSQQFIASLPEAHRNAIYETAALFEGVEGKSEGGKAQESQIYVLGDADYRQVQKDLGLPEGGRGFAIKDGKVYINGQHQSTQGPGGAQELAHTAGHELGGHQALNILRAMTGKDGNLFKGLMDEARKELGKTKDGQWKASPEFQRFVDSYNARLPDGARKLSADSPDAFEEFISETAGQLISAKGTADIVMPEGIRDRLDRAAGRFFGKMFGVDTRITGTATHFNREESGAITGAYLDAMRRIADVRFRPEQAETQADPGSLPTETPTSKVSKSTETSAPPLEPAPAGLDAMADPYADLGIDQAIVDATRDHWVAPPGLEPTSQRANSRKGIPGKSADKIAEERAAEFDAASKAYFDHLRTTGQQAPKSPLDLEQAIIEHSLSSGPQPAKAVAPAATGLAALETAPAPETTQPAPEGLAGLERAPEAAPQPEASPEQRSSLEGVAQVSPEEIQQRLEAAKAKAVQDTGGKQTKDAQKKVAEAEIDELMNVATEVAQEGQLRKTQDEFGDEVWRGRVDPENPVHRVILDRAGIKADSEPEKKLLTLQNSMGKLVFIRKYASAEKALGTEEQPVVGLSQAQRAEEQKASTADQRAQKKADPTKASGEFVEQDKSLIPLYQEVTSTGKILVGGISPDKFVSNAKKLIDFVKSEKMDAGYRDINDPQLVEDAKAYAANHAHGWKGDGSRAIEGAEVDPNYTPVEIPKNRFDLLNAAFKYESSTASSRHAKKSLEYETKKTQGVKGLRKPVLTDKMKAREAEAQKLALLNVQPMTATGEVNPLRDFINKSGRFTAEEGGKTRKGTQEILEDVIEVVRPDLINGGIEETASGQEGGIRGSGFKGDLSALASEGMPRGKYVAAGFMPDSEMNRDKISPLDIDPDGGGYFLAPDGTLYDVDSAGSHPEWMQKHDIRLEDGWLRVVASDGNLYWQGEGANNAQLRTLKDASKSNDLPLVRDRSPLYMPDTPERNRIPKYKSLWLDRSGNVKGVMREQGHADMLRDMPEGAAKSMIRGRVVGSTLHFDTPNLTPAQRKFAQRFAEEHGLKVKANDRIIIDPEAQFMPEELLESTESFAVDRAKEFKNERGIKSAAIHLPDGEIIEGAVHALALWEAKERGYSDSDIKASESGFVDGSGNFLSRDEARERALAMGQVESGATDAHMEARGLGQMGMTSQAFNAQQRRSDLSKMMPDEERKPVTRDYVEEMDMGQFEKRASKNERDEFFYHVTTDDRVDGIMGDSEIRPGEAPQFSTAAPSNNSKGRVFITERDGVNFWASRIAEQIEHSRDLEEDQDASDFIRVIKIPKRLIKGQKLDDQSGEMHSDRDFYVDGPISLDDNAPGSTPDPSSKLSKMVEEPTKPKTNREIINEAMAKFDAGEIDRKELAKIIRENSPHLMPDTPEFKEWFEGSKIVDKNGNPIRLYHGGSFNVAEDGIFLPWSHFGTRGSAMDRIGGKIVDDMVNSAEIFEHEGKWYYEMDGATYDKTGLAVDELDLTDGFRSRDEADEAMRIQAVYEGSDREVNEDSANLTEVYLRLKNPVRLPDLGTWGIDDVIRNLPKEAKLTSEERERVNELHATKSSEEGWKELTKILEGKGYDGVVYKNEIEDKGSDSYMVFDSRNIKSATDNSGDFDPENPDIRMMPDSKGLAALEDEPSSKLSKKEDGSSGLSALGSGIRPEEIEVNGRKFQVGRDEQSGKFAKLMPDDENLSIWHTGAAKKLSKRARNVLLKHDISSFSDLRKAIDSGEANKWSGAGKGVLNEVKSLLGGDAKMMPEEESELKRQKFFFGKTNPLISEGLKRDENEPVSLHNAKVEVLRILEKRGALTDDALDSVRDWDANDLESRLWDIGEKRTLEEIESDHEGEETPEEWGTSKGLFEWVEAGHPETDEITLAGYVLPDGKMLNFSHDGRQRDQDHREINWPGSSGGTEKMIAMMNAGAMRIDANSGNISLRRPPTGAQERAILEIVDLEGTAYIDAEAPSENGWDEKDRLSIEVDADNSDKAIKKIRAFFNKHRSRDVKMMPDASPFYSQLERVASEKIKGRATSEQILSTLKNNGVKQDELDWVLGDFLREKAGQKISPEELREQIAANKVELKEVIKGKPTKERQDKARRLIELQDTLENRKRRGYDDLLPEDREEMDLLDAEFDDGTMTRNELLSIINNAGPGAPKFSQYQLPGGENYREFNYVLPPKDELPPGFKVFQQDDVSLEKSWGIEFPDGTKLGGWPSRDAAIRSQGRQPNSPTYKVPPAHQYGDEADINRIFHARVNDRTTSDGTKLLFAEEIQSDWHQKGRKEGYARKATEEEIKRLGELEEEMEKLRSKWGSANEWLIERKRNGNEEAQKDWDKLLALKDESTPLYNLQGLPRPYSMESAKAAVPNAPFKGHGWKTLAIKKLLAKAVEEGKDAIGWTTGEQQAERYDLSKQVDRVTWNANNQRFSAWKGDQEMITGKYTPEQLPDVVGKEAAEKLVNGKQDEKGSVVLEGEDLKVGGEGMKGFYDKELVNIANDLGKKYGAKVTRSRIGGRKEPYVVEFNGQERGNFPTREEAVALVRELGEGATINYNAAEDHRTAKVLDDEVWTLPITPKLKEAIQAGQALFMPDSGKTKKPKRDVMQELREEGVLDGGDSEVPEEAHAYFAIGHDDPNGKNWIYDTSTRSVKAKVGGTHGANFGHEKAGNTFKGWYDSEHDVISVAFPEHALRKIEGKPTEDDIPEAVYKALRSKFGKTAAIIAFLPSVESASAQATKKEGLAGLSDEEEEEPQESLEKLGALR